MRASPKKIDMVDRVWVDIWHDLRRIVNKESPVCIDVGANIGQTVDNLLGTFKSPCIYSFEPSTKVFNILNSKGYGDNVNLFNYALGSNNQKREFINYTDCSVLSSFLPLDRNEKNPFIEVNEESREVVQIETIDTFLFQNNIETVDLLKIDTQGFDFDVLRGADKALKAGIINYVFIEINFIKLYEGQANPDDIIKFLAENGLFLIDYYEKKRRGGNVLAWCTALFGKK